MKGGRGRADYTPSSVIFLRDSALLLSAPLCHSGAWHRPVLRDGWPEVLKTTEVRILVFCAAVRL